MLDRNELGRLMKRLGQALTEEELHEMMMEVTGNDVVDGEPVISIEEFKELMNS